jgi:hypothetical protein
VKCDNCGLPRGVGKANSWKPSGVIVSRFEDDFRGIFYGVGEMNTLFESLSDRIAYDITHLVVEAKRKESAHYTRSLLGRLRESGVELPGPEEFFRIMAANFSIPGFGKVEVIDYRDGESVTLETEGIYSLPMGEGQAAGVFEGVLDKRAAVVREGDVVRARILLKVAEAHREVERRMEAEVEQASPLAEVGDREYTLCPRCGAPLELSNEFDWDLDKAIITQRHTGERYIFDNTRGITAVVKLLIEELGDEIESMLVDISREYARDFYHSLNGTTSVEAELSRFPLRGWGLPSGLRESNGGYELQVINPFYSPIIHGKIWGMLEVFGGEELSTGDVAENDGVFHLSYS